MKEKIYQIILSLRDDVSVSQLNDSTDLIEELGFDSLNTIKLLVAIEEALSIEIDFDNFSFDILNNAGKFCDYIISLESNNV